MAQQQRKTIGNNPLDAMASEQQAAAAATSRRAERTSRAAVEAGGSYLEASGDMARRVFDAWVQGTETTLQAAFDLENTALQTSLDMMDAGARNSRAAATQWSEVARQAQQAALDAFRATIKASGGLAQAATEREPAGRREG